MILIGIALGILGLLCLMIKKTLLGVVIGVQLITFGSGAVFVLSGVLAGAHDDGHLFGVFILLNGVAQIVVCYALATRLYYQKKTIRIDELRSLKH